MINDNIHWQDVLNFVYNEQENYLITHDATTYSALTQLSTALSGLTTKTTTTITEIQTTPSKVIEIIQQVELAIQDEPQVVVNYNGVRRVEGEPEVIIIPSNPLYRKVCTDNFDSIRLWNECVQCVNTWFAANPNAQSKDFNRGTTGCSRGSGVTPKVKQAPYYEYQLNQCCTRKDWDTSIGKCTNLKPEPTPFIKSTGIQIKYK